MFLMVWYQNNKSMKGGGLGCEDTRSEFFADSDEINKNSSMYTT